MTSHRIVLATALLATVPACASMSGAARDPVGCYFFESGQAVQTLRLPEGIHLTDRPLEGWPAIQARGDVKVAVTLRSDGTADYPFGYWLRESADSLEVGYPSGGAIVLDLMFRGRALEGTARALGDARPFSDEPEALPVRLEPGTCPG